MDKEDWIAEGKRLGAKYTVNMMDIFDYDHYPKFANSDEEMSKLRSENGQNMQRIYEVWLTETGEQVPLSMFPLFEDRL